MTRYKLTWKNLNKEYYEEITEYCKPLTYEVFWGVINDMFEYACVNGCDAMNLRAWIDSRCGDDYYLANIIDMITVVDGSTIWVNVFVDGKFVRRMYIAQ